jgi:hypothetical protein
MAVTPTTIKTRYPEFASVADARIQVFIDDAELEMDEGRWGDLYDRGLSALTAHLLAIANRNAASAGTGISIGGALTARTIGSLSASFGSSPSNGSTEDYLRSTAYGADYLRLVQIVGTDIVVVC